MIIIRIWSNKEANLKISHTRHYCSIKITNVNYLYAAMQHWCVAVAKVTCVFVQLDTI